MLSFSSPSTPTQSKPRTKKPETHPHSKWKTQTQQRVYSRRLLDALRTHQPASARSIKEAADSALALTAHGQTRWSRAILTTRRPKLRLKRKKPKKPCCKKIEIVDKVEGEDEKKVNDRLRKLGNLVPGCKKLTGPTLLEEAADYVAALEVQVKAMKALAEALTAVSVSGALEGDNQDGEGN